MSAFSPKTTSEVIDLTVNFTYLLSPGETISSATVYASVLTGVDPSPASLLLGTPTIVASLVTQRLNAGVANTVYAVSFGALTSSSQYFIETHSITVTA